MRARQRAVVFGLGASWLTVPALVRAGVPETGIVSGTTLLRPELAEVASCYGACHAALEHGSGRNVPLNP